MQYRNNKDLQSIVQKPLISDTNIGTTVTRAEVNATMIYPSLPARYDLGIIRIGGAGIGNCLYTYFHAVVMAKAINSPIIAPTWSSVRIGPLLRRELSLRRYGRMFRAHPDEISGIMKAILLI